MTLTTFNAANDQWIQRVGAAYPPTGAVQRNTATATVQCGHTFDGSTYYTQIALLSFDTSGIPDTDTVLDATLRIWVTDNTNINTTNVTADWYAWDGVSDTDYTDTAGTNAIAGTSISSLTVGQDNDIPLLNATANVSKTSSSYLRLHGTGGAVTSFNDLQFAAIEHTTQVEARLIVNHVSVTRIAPDAILAQTNLTGAVSVIQDDPDSPDANWLTAP